MKSGRCAFLDYRTVILVSLRVLNTGRYLNYPPHFTVSSFDLHIARQEPSSDRYPERATEQLYSVFVANEKADCSTGNSLGAEVSESLRVARIALHGKAAEMVPNHALNTCDYGATLSGHAHVKKGSVRS